MTDWRPIKCPYCGYFHEQPGASKAVSRCYEHFLVLQKEMESYGDPHSHDLPDELSEKA